MRYGGTMAIDDKTRNFDRVTFGSLLDKSVCKVSFGHTETNKKVAAASDTAVHAAITLTKATAQTITTGITNPDVPRVLKVQPGGTNTDLGNGVVVVTGLNVEGRTITDSFQLVDGDSTEIEGTKAFKTVSSILVPAAEGKAATVSVGYTNKLGLYHRLYPNNTTVKVVYRSSAYGTPTLDSTPTINDADEYHVEKNFITPNTTPDAAKIFDIFYIYDYWTVGEVSSYEEWSTSTSTSSTSTSTTTSYTTTSTSSTSTSSTSSSTSSTSSSTSSTSSSTSATTISTSTTTVP